MTDSKPCPECDGDALLDKLIKLRREYEEYLRGPGVLHTIYRFCFRLDERIRTIQWMRGERSCWTCPFFYDEVARGCKYPGPNKEREPDFETGDTPEWCPLIGGHEEKVTK